MIHAESLSKRYGPLTAIKDVSFTAKKGDVLGFLGPNGAGKTTTMRIITGFMPPSEGRAEVAGFDVFEKPKEIKKRIGYLPERPPLYEDMVVRTYLEYVAELKGLDGASRGKAVEKAVESCGLEDVVDRLSGHLSKGYKQRLGIAQAIVNDPEVLILDEPTIGLDPRQIVEMREMIRTLAGERTVILSSHILSEVAQICNKVVIINRGKVVAADTLGALKQSLQMTEKVRLRVRNNDAPVESVVKALEGVGSVTAREDGWIVEAEKGCNAAESVAKLVIDKGWGLEEVSHLEVSLEDIFLQFIKKDEDLRKQEANGAKTEPESESQFASGDAVEGGE